MAGGSVNLTEPETKLIATAVTRLRDNPKMVRHQGSMYAVDVSGRLAAGLSGMVRNEEVKGRVTTLNFVRTIELCADRLDEIATEHDSGTIQLARDLRAFGATFTVMEDDPRELVPAHARSESEKRGYGRGPGSWTGD